MAITIEQAKELKYGQLVHFYRKGKCDNWKVTGKVKLWKRNPNRIEIPVKHGLYSHGKLNQFNLFNVHLESDCPLCQNRRLTIAECISMVMSKGELIEHYGLKNCDTAIPEPLFTELLKFGDISIFNFCYSYDVNKTFGELYPLTIEGENRMRELGMPIPELK